MPLADTTFNTVTPVSTVIIATVVTAVTTVTADIIVTTVTAVTTIQNVAVLLSFIREANLWCKNYGQFPYFIRSRQHMKLSMCYLQINAFHLRDIRVTNVTHL